MDKKKSVAKKKVVKGKIITCGFCKGSGRDNTNLDGICSVCKGKGKVRV